ncbi:MAG: hypothetical protein JO296_11535 [Pseudonocardiales bacterium]|nr:hypothetical protein [Pseudonocardiales bacterium]MBV9650757.1 hypothetical protein [Pseudonocardiales bacterium]
MTTSTTTSRDTISDTARRGQETYANAVHLWVDSIQKVIGSLPTPDSKLLHEVVDDYFTVAEQVLATQRKFANSVLAATASAVTDARSAAQDVARDAAAKTS